MINVAKTAGFCFGVERAVERVYQLLEQDKRPLYTFGPLIHNEDVVKDLEQKGVRVIHTLEEADKLPPGSRIVIRTHGLPKSYYDFFSAHAFEVIDLTCPFVQKIQKTVEKCLHEGDSILISGDPEHPEVIGINGWCGDRAIIIKTPEQLTALNLDSDKTYALVAQTTYSVENYKKIIKFLKKGFTEVKIFDTICNATSERQEEAGRLSKQADVMVVIGGLHSSNTQKLFEICTQNCPKTFYIENADGLPDVSEFHGKTVGITAGASTPAQIIKEVARTMSEEKILETADTEKEESFAEAFEKSLVTLNTGDIVKGTVIRITPTEVFVNLGYKMDGYIPLDELTNAPINSAEEIVNVGDEIEVFIVRVNDVEGSVLLSKKKIDSIKGWKVIEAAYESGEVLDGRIVEIVNGGVIALHEGARVFIPASQASDRYLQDLGVLLNEQVSFKIIDINARRRRAVGSIKVVLIERKKIASEQIWSSIEVGKHYQGVVKMLAAFGAFVDIGGVDGLVHVSEMSWERIKNPSEVMTVGDVIDVYVIGFDAEKKKISLGYKKQEDNPWVKAKEKYSVGEVIQCNVVRLVPFGAFVQLDFGIDGLIHISQISNQRINKPSDVLTVGQEVSAQIVEVDCEKQKISLSIRALLPEQPPMIEKEEDPEVPNAYSEDFSATVGDAVSNETPAEAEVATEEQAPAETEVTAETEAE